MSSWAEATVGFTIRKAGARCSARRLFRRFHVRGARHLRNTSHAPMITAKAMSAIEAVVVSGICSSTILSGVDAFS
jgi:hypothetical protein